MALIRPFRQGDIVELTPTRFGKRGEAEGEYEGWRVRVAGGIPGETARVRIVHVSKGGRVAEGKWMEPAADPDPSRREPPCPIHDRCGGCGLQQIETGAALASKVAQAPRITPDWHRDYTLFEQLQAEVDVLGMIVSIHPLEPLANAMKKAGFVPGADMARYEGRHIRAGGILVSFKPATTKAKGDPMALISLEDLSGTFDTVVFPEAYARYAMVLRTKYSTSNWPA